MVGGGNRKDDLVISNTNVFAALGTLRKKKKSDKDGKNKSSSGGSSSAHKQERKEAEPLVFWAPAPLTAKSWADVDDEDDDDYYATTAPPQSVWAGSGGEAEHKPQPKESSTPVEHNVSWQYSKALLMRYCCRLCMNNLNHQCRINYEMPIAYM
ncbi:hypothetical protein M9H77_01844 [Catharanthus roseus]|uniref:Uncharacterized protein n=1 Tax=Catharanthus roseus TaxID=4058 RepID=A0ACC0C6R0_CATRO|nr:hypothetical protein M9H77_01844 [Catharanthus roseus]